MDEALVRLARSVPPGRRGLAGTAALLLAAWVGIYGHLWSFERLDQHRVTARAILSGTLRLRSAVSLVQNDEQIYNGALYTNWGVGVPLLQVPFHAFAGMIGLFRGFFPDRAIFFLYAALAIPVLWAAFRRLLTERALPGSTVAERAALSWTATWVVLASVLFPLTSTRFVIYEETIAYFVVFQLLALSAYLFALRSWSYASVCGLALAAGFGVLIRPTGVPYAALWCLIIAIEGRAKKALAFVATIVPFVACWLYTNWQRTGSPVGLGFVNSTPAWTHNMPIERFGSHCSDTLPHALQGAVRLFTGFFLFVTHRASTDWLEKCHFDFEQRGAVLPFFGPFVLVLLVWLIRELVVRRERRLSLWAPHLLIATFFLLFVLRGMGFAWRYAADFWPAILIACVQHVVTREPAPPRFPPARVAKVLFWYGLGVYAMFLLPWLWEPVPEIVPASVATAASIDSRRDEALPSRIACGDELAPIFQNGLGWRPDCRVDTFTNILLGVPAKRGDRYRVVASTEGMTATTLRMYVNGTIYPASNAGDSYLVDVTIPYERLVSPIVVVTVEWTRAFEPPPGRLLSIEVR